MMGTLDFLLHKGQKFKRRVDQYKVVGYWPESPVHERMIVKHRVTHEKFLMKKIASNVPEEIKLQIRTELLALQQCS